MLMALVQDLGILGYRLAEGSGRRGGINRVMFYGGSGQVVLKVLENG
jgi:hypothetical protein